MNCRNCDMPIHFMTRVEALNAGGVSRRYIHDHNGLRDCGRLDMVATPNGRDLITNHIACVECRRCVGPVSVAVAARTGGYCEGCCVTSLPAPAAR